MPDRPRPRPNNVGASVRQRLLNLAHARGQPMELLLTRYALERLLHRLSLSPHRERFVLKGAMLLATWFDEPHRATRDVVRRTKWRAAWRPSARTARDAERD